MFNGVVKILECWHVLWLKKKLISFSTLNLKGFRFHGDNEILKIVKSLMVYIMSSVRGNLYILQGTIVQGIALVTIKSNDMNNIKLWHIRLEYMSERGLS